MDTKNKSYRLTIIAILTAIIIVQSMVPFLGFIPIGPVSLTIIHITVIVAAIVLDTKTGMIIGGVWGVLTMVRAWTMPTSPIDTLVFTNPLVSLIPRILVGAFAGLAFSLLYKRMKTITLPAIIASCIGSLTNTGLVLLMMGTHYTEPIAQEYGTTSDNLFNVLMGIVATNGVAEMIFAAIVAPLIVKAIFSATSLSPEARIKEKKSTRKS